MLRSVAVSIALAVSAIHGARAQGPAPKPATTDTLAAHLLGTWDGRFVTDHGTGALQITVSKEAVWKVAIEMAHDDQAIPTRVSDVKVAGKTISWRQEVMGMTCDATATVNGLSMNGDASCGALSYKMELQKK